MDSGHAEVAALLIEAGADRERVRFLVILPSLCFHSDILSYEVNHDGEAPEDVPGVGGVEQKRAKQYVIERCGDR